MKYKNTYHQVIDNDDTMDMKYSFHQFNCVDEWMRWYIPKWQLTEQKEYNRGNKRINIKGDKNELEQSNK